MDLSEPVEGDGERGQGEEGGVGIAARVEREEKRQNARRPMDLTESFTKRCRAILYFIFERHADWTRTLTALVVMLYNAPYMPLSCRSSLSL